MSEQQRNNKSKNEAPAGGRSQVTGVKMGKGARRALLKNAECVDELLDAIQRAQALERSLQPQPTAKQEAVHALEKLLTDRALVLARVTRATGAGRLEVALHTGEKGVSVPIAGTVKFKGKAGTKTDRANCMCANDVIVVRGGQANAKVSPSTVNTIRRAFEHFGLRTPVGFFVAQQEEEGDGWEFDRSEEEAEEKEAVAALKVQAAKAGGGPESESDADAVEIGDL
jgi:hypothetical protein